VLGGVLGGVLGLSAVITSRRSSAVASRVGWVGATPTKLDKRLSHAPGVTSPDS
jgi:hypothetical protein